MFLRPSDALLLSLAEPRGNSIRRSDPDRTDAVDLGNDATCLGLECVARIGLAVGTFLVALGRLAMILRGAGGGRMAALSGAGGGGATLRAIFCFGFGAVDLGGNGGGSGDLGRVGTTFTAGGFAILRGWTVAILGGGGTMAAGVLTIDGGGGDVNVRGVLATGGSFFGAVRRTTLFLVVRFARLAAFLAGLRVVRRFVAVGGVRTRRSFRTRLLDFEITGNFGPVRYGLLR